MLTVAAGGRGHRVLLLYMFENFCNKKRVGRSTIILLIGYLIKEKISASHSSNLFRELSI